MNERFESDREQRSVDGASEREAIRRSQRIATSSMITAGVAGLVGLLALGVSIYEAMLNREQARVSVMPIMGSFVGYDFETLSITVMNRGLGPAVIHDVSVDVDGEPVSDWREVLQAVATGPLRLESVQQQMLSGDVMAPGDQGTIVSFIGEGVPAIRAESGRVALSLCYCSVFGDCWAHRVHDLLEYRAETAEVGECRADAGTLF